MRNEIELMQMTTRFRLNNARETPLHKWSVALLSTAAYSVADAGNIVTFTNGFRYHTHPQDFNRGRAQSGPFLIFLGELLFFSRTSAAAAIDIVHSIRVKDREFDRKTFESRAVALNTLIERQLKDRQAQIGNDPAARAEQVVLEDLAKQSRREFVLNYARASHIATFRLWDNSFANATSATGAFAGALPTYLAAVNKRPRVTGPGGIGFVVSGSMFMADVAVAKLAATQAEHLSRKRLESRLLSSPATGKIDLNADLAQLQAVAPAPAASTPPTEPPPPSPIISRQQGYRLMQQAFADHDRIDARERQRDRRKTVHDQIWNMIEGGANLAAGAVITDAGFKFHPGPNPLKQYFGARHFLTRFSWGAVTFTPSASGGIIDTPAEALVSSFYNARDARRQLEPQSVLNQRLLHLNQAVGLAQ